MKKLILIIIGFFLTYACYGQNNTPKISSLSFSTGLNYIKFKDRTFSPIVFSGLLPEINLGFRKTTEKNSLWNIDLNLSYGTVNHTNNYFESTFVSAQLAFNYLKEIKSDKKSRIYLGGQIRSILNVMDYEGFASGSWYSAQQLEPILIYDYTITNRQSIRGQFHCPIFNLVSRPSYAGVDEFVVVNSDNISKILYSRLKVYSLNKIINPNFEIQYLFKLKKINFSFSTRYSYLQVNSIRRYKRNQLNLNLGIHIKIGKNDEK